MRTDTHEKARMRQFAEGIVPFADDLVVMVLAYVTAYALRFNFVVPAERIQEGMRAFPVVVTLQVGALLLFGCYRLVWRFISACDVPRFIYAICSSTALLVTLRVLLSEERAWRPPLGIAMINGGFVLSGLLLVRVLWRLGREGENRSPRQRAASRRVLLVGAGETGNTVARELRQHRDEGLDVIGFLDDDPAKQRSFIQGVPVRGLLSDLARLIVELRVEEVIVTMVQAPRDVVRQVVRTCEAAGRPVRIAPGYFEILDGSLSVSRLREVDIADLLGREEVDLGADTELARFITGRCVLITGAGGSIGSELARQVARLGPQELVLVERSEHALYEIDRTLRDAGKGSLLRSLVADIGDTGRMRAILERHRPHIVLHAAAHKQVPMMESNVVEAVRNNVIATRRLGEIAAQCGVGVFVLLSTDKAVNPSSVMGATKRLAESALQDLNQPDGTRFVAVRFGNVLGSTGSVVPLFREQIRRGGPVTVTHPDMQRYFMTIPEAVRLVLHAAAMATGGEIFILDMGEPVRIVELAEEMIRLSGLKPYEDIPIVFTGIRPGEKLFEELSTDAERALKTRHPRIFIGKIPAAPRAAVVAWLSALDDLCTRGAPDEAVRANLMRLI